MLRWHRQPPAGHNVCAATLDVIHKILVLDGEQRAALAVVRSLGRHGCTVRVASTRRRSLAGASRYATGNHEVPSPLLEPEAYRRAVDHLAAELNVDLVMPITEASWLALLESPDGGRSPPLPMTDLARFRRASNKEEVLTLASRLGLSVPEQWTILSPTGIESLIPRDAFPVVIKPARSIGGPRDRREQLGVDYARTPEELSSKIAGLGEELGPYLIQRRIEGPGIGVFALRWNGRVLATFAHQRVREKPPSGGVSVCSQSVAVSPSLLSGALSLLEALDWEGVAMIEFKRDRRSGDNYLMEVNPRFWGSLQLAVDSGVDFPWYLVQVALGLPVTPVTSWRVGARLRWFLGDIDHLIARILRTREELHLDSRSPGFLRAAASVLLPWRPGQRGEVFRLEDPMPAVHEAVAWIRAS